MKAQRPRNHGKPRTCASTDVRAAQVGSKIRAREPGGSIKDRIALLMVEATKRRQLKLAAVVEPRRATPACLAMVAA